MKLNVNLPNHPYDIVIEKGILAKAGEWLASLWSDQKLVVITDNHVASLYVETVKRSLELAGFEVFVFNFLEGEASKNLTTVTNVYEFLAKVGLTRSDGIVALGGGVVGDLAGFVASTYMRGVHFVQIPTSLTAQVDSSIGGKTGVNTPWAKNMVGTFTQPDGVLIDPDVLKTLGQRELIEGMGEVIKYGLIEDVELWKELSDMDGSPESILEHAESIIYHSCNVKRKLVVE
ncbi:MAG: 3-dehydroquinate synthase, partial [Streptococcus sp.]